MEKTWRDAKIPKWVEEDIVRELKSVRKAAALSWPTEPSPEPAPFRWVEYDHTIGQPEAGVYWSNNHRGVAVKVEIAAQDRSVVDAWKPWRFRVDCGEWTSSVVRGPLYYSERDAALAHLWNECERCANILMGARDKIYA